MTERFPSIKFLIFALVCAGFTGWLAIQIGNISFESRIDYAAQFDDVQGLLINDEVKISGVTLGRVEEIDHLPGGVAEVTFSVRDDVAIPEDSEIVVRWKNVFGLRFLYVEPGQGDTRAEEGHTFGVAQTRAPADLGSLLQRLTPFIQALDPELQNQVLQGLSEGLVGREDQVQDLISQGATLTEKVSTREAEIESLLSNSATIFESYAEREEQMRGLIESFAEVSTTLSARNDEIEDAIVGLADGQEELRRFVETNEGEVRLLLDALEDLTDVTNAHHEELARTLRTGPRGFVAYHLISRTGQWFNIRAVGASVADTVVSTERGAAYPREDGSSTQGSSPDSALEQFFGGGQG